MEPRPSLFEHAQLAHERKHALETHRLGWTGNFRIETSALHFAGDTLALASRPATSPLLRVERRYSFRKIWNDRSRRCTIAIGHRKLKRSGATSSLSASTSGAASQPPARIRSRCQLPVVSRSAGRRGRPYLIFIARRFSSIDWVIWPRSFSTFTQTRKS